MGTTVEMVEWIDHGKEGDWFGAQNLKKRAFPCLPRYFLPHFWKSIEE